MPRTKQTRSQAALILSDRGVTLREVAAALGVSVSAVSMQLAGRRPTHAGLIPVIRCLAGVSAASSVERLLDGRAAE